MRFRPVTCSPRTRKKKGPTPGAELNVTAHCAHPRPRSTETTKQGVRAETSRQCLSPGGGLFYMRFRPATYSPRPRKKNRPNLGPNFALPRTALTHGPDRPRPRNTACEQRLVIGA